MIQRPAPKAFDTSNVIKADQFPTWHGQFVENFGFTDMLKLAVNVRGLDTIKEWGEKLARQHRPTNLLEFPEFLRPGQPAPDFGRKPAPQPPPAVPTTSAAPAQKDSTPRTTDRADQPPAKRLLCAHCRAKITYPEGKFCWNNEKRFGGLQYCREHQAMF